MGFFDVLATNGNTRLGGVQFNQRLVKFFEQNDFSIDSSDVNVQAIIRKACEKARKDLSIEESTEIVVGDHKVPITRSQYEQLISSYIDTTMQCVEYALKDADLEKKDIDKIVLVGGCTYTPLIRTSLQQFFEKECQTDVNPMESVALGACVQAAVLKRKIGVPSMYVRNVTPLSIGLVNSDKKCYPIIKRNTTYPTMKRITGNTKHANQTRVKVIITEGEHKDIERNRILGSMILEGITSSPKGVELIDVTLKINEQGMVTALAVDKKTKIQKTLEIERPQIFTQSEVSQMVKTIGELKKAIEIKVDSQIDVKLNSDPNNKRIKMEDDQGADVQVICPIYGIKASSEIEKLIELEE